MKNEAPKAADTQSPIDAMPEANDPAPQAADAPATEAIPHPAEAERDQLKDKLLRTLAEMENMRRRTEREISDAKSYGIASFARDMLAVADNMERAISAIPAETRAALEGPWKALVDGVELTERDLLKLLEKHGVKRVTPDGEKFDPNFHQAMFEVPSNDVAPGTVMQTIQAGFKIGERILRPALVGVAKAMPQPKTAPEPASPESGVAGESPKL